MIQTLGIQASYEVGGAGFDANERYCILQRREGFNPELPAVIYPHSRGGDESTWSVIPDHVAICLALAGYAVVPIFAAHRANWGNQASEAQLVARAAWCRDPAGLGAADLPPLIWCGSMGTITTLVTAALHPGIFSACAIAVPIPGLKLAHDFISVHAQDMEGTGVYAALNASNGLAKPGYGSAAGYTANKYARDPMDLAATGVYNNLPMRFYISATPPGVIPDIDDPVARSADAEAFAALVGGQEPDWLQYTDPIGHDSSAVDALDVLYFYRRYTNFNRQYTSFMGRYTSWP